MSTDNYKSYLVKKKFIPMAGIELNQLSKFQLDISNNAKLFI